MNLLKQAALALALLAPLPALAADGLLTLVVGIPVLVVATIILGILLSIKSRKTVKNLATLLFIPTLAFSLYVMLDAITMLSDVGTENFGIGFAFFALLALACFLFFLLIRRRAI